MVNKGDRFLCTKSVLMEDGVVAYSKGKTYISEIDHCITDDQGNKEHEWQYDFYEDDQEFNEFFKKLNDSRVDHPKYYNSHPSGVECIDIIRHYCFDIGSAIKYLWRAGLKVEEGLTNKQKEIEDIKKAIWYLNDRIKQLEGE